jgi:GNAT superfamily N-acetyltransferase
MSVPDATHIRAAVAAERVALEALQTRASLANPGDRAALIANPDAIELPATQIEAGQVFVAERSGTVMGFAAILPRSDGDTELDALFVDPNVWRRGIGRLLVERCASAAKTGGSAALHVIGNPHAQRFYLACGFTNVGTTATRFGKGLLFRKLL